MAVFRREFFEKLLVRLCNAYVKEIIMGIKNNVNPEIMTAVATMLSPYYPGLNTVALQKALETYNPNADESKNPSCPQKPLTRKEAAEMLGVSVPTVVRYIKKGCLTPVRYSARAVRITAESVYSLMKGGMV